VTWRNVSSNPLSAEAQAYRALQLAGKWRPSRLERGELIESLCRGKRVLDLGCVDEGSREIGRLHQKLRRSASRCVGADYDVDGINNLRAQGHHIVYADVTRDPPEELLGQGPFDVVVAGEIIEHLSDPGALFRFSAPLLDPHGELLITTPNPYALHRVRSGWKHVTWENVDHVAYMFPSGIAELADRHRMELRWYGTAGASSSLLDPPKSFLRSVRRFWAVSRRRAQARVQRTDPDRAAQLPGWYSPPMIILLRPLDWSSMKETAVYSIGLVAGDQ
jgi:2-polyprenyl-3-methyl-5-hydroxy-6-metoxy-1,4-benzoquinol methylase